MVIFSGRSNTRVTGNLHISIWDMDSRRDLSTGRMVVQTTRFSMWIDRTRRQLTPDQSISARSLAEEQFQKKELNLGVQQ
jgi:hypothetical protein